MGGWVGGAGACLWQRKVLECKSPFRLLSSSPCQPTPPHCALCRQAGAQGAAAGSLCVALAHPFYPPTHPATYMHPLPALVLIWLQASRSSRRSCRSTRGCPTPSAWGTSTCFCTSRGSPTLTCQVGGRCVDLLSGACVWASTIRGSLSLTSQVGGRCFASHRVWFGQPRLAGPCTQRCMDVAALLVLPPQRYIITDRPTPRCPPPCPVCRHRAHCGRREDQCAAAGGVQDHHRLPGRALAIAFSGGERERGQPRSSRRLHDGAGCTLAVGSKRDILVFAAFAAGVRSGLHHRRAQLSSCTFVRESGIK